MSVYLNAVLLSRIVTEGFVSFILERLVFPEKQILLILFALVSTYSQVVFAIALLK